MKQTFYTVKYRIWGSDFCQTAWFDSLEAARDFASRKPAADPPTHHTFRRLDSIQTARDLVDFQRLSERLEEIRNS